MSYKHDMERYVRDNWPGVEANVTVMKNTQQGNSVTFRVEIIYSRDLKAEVMIPMTDVLANVGAYETALDMACQQLAIKQKELDDVKQRIKEQEAKKVENIFDRANM